MAARFLVNEWRGPVSKKRGRRANVGKLPVTITISLSALIALAKRLRILKNCVILPIIGGCFLLYIIGLKINLNSTILRNQTFVSFARCRHKRFFSARSLSYEIRFTREVCEPVRSPLRTGLGVNAKESEIPYDRV